MAIAKNIIVGVEMPESRPWDAANLSAPTRLAVRQAFDVAEATGAAIKLVCVLPPVGSGIFGSDEEAATEEEEDRASAMKVMADVEVQYLQRIKRALTVSSAATTGRPWLEILKAAGPATDNLIICGTRDKSAVSRLLFGSTGQKLLRNAPCPVWLVKPRIDDDADLDVLAATDLSGIGQDVLEHGVALGQNLPVRLNVLHVVDDNLDRHMARAGMPEEEVVAHRQNLKQTAELELGKQLDQTDYRTVEKGVQSHIAEGPADACILSAIDELDIDLLIMATSGRGGIPGMLFGNTAERLLPELPCSVLVIKPDDFECPIDLTD